MYKTVLSFKTETFIVLDRDKVVVVSGFTWTKTMLSRFRSVAPRVVNRVVPKVVPKVANRGYWTPVSPAPSLLAWTMSTTFGCGLGYCLAVYTKDDNKAPRLPKSTPRLVDKLTELTQDFSKPTTQLTSFIERKEFSAEIHKCLTDKYRTMNVLWAPPGAGKTTYVWEVSRAWEIASSKTRKVFYVSNYATTNLNDVLKDLNVKDIADLKAQLAENPTFEVVLVLDSFDQAFETHHSETIRPWLLDLLEATSDKFHVLCVMSKPHKAKQVLDWKQKIGLCGTTFSSEEAYKIANFKWTPVQIAMYINTYPTTLTNREKRNFIAASRCGNIRFMNKMFGNQHWVKPYFWNKTFKRRLAMYEERWKYGISVLSQ